MLICQLSNSECYYKFQYDILMCRANENKNEIPSFIISQVKLFSKMSTEIAHLDICIIVCKFFKN